MGFFLIIFTSILMFLFLSLSLFILKIFTGKSIRDPNYPPVKGTVFHMFLYFNRLYDYQTEVAKTHSTFRVLVPDHSEVYTADTRNIEHVLKTNFASYSKGAFTQSILSDIFGQGIFLVDGEKWKQQRKLASFEFSTRVLRDVSCSVFRRNAAKLVRVVFGISSSGGVFDMQDLLMRCTLDSIFKVGFGIELHCLERSSQEGTAFMKAFDESTALSYFRYIDPFWKLKRIFNLGHEASLKKYVKVMDDFVNQVISSKRRLQEEQKDVIDKEDILSRFLLESAKNPEEMNDKYLRDIILSFMFAGKDTSANTLSWFFYMLSKNPLQEKVVQEVRDVVGNQVGEAKVDEFVENITEETLERMHYLHAALTETLRLYPAVPIAGPRICLGKDFAYRQMKIVAMALLSFFRFKLADETKPVTYRTMFTLHIDGSLPMIAVPRTT